jgi:hypothetical protein
MTPLLKEDAVFDALTTVSGSAAVVIGSEDHHYDEARLESLAARRNVMIVVQPDGNHSLNAGNSAGESAQSLTEIIKRLEVFYGFKRSNRYELD